MTVEQPAVCGRCHIMPAAAGEAWCVDCAENDSPGDYVAGVHISQLDPTERPWQPTQKETPWPTAR